MDNSIYKEPLCLNVKHELAFEFRALVEKIPNCEVRKVIEIKTCEILQYWIDCPKEKEDEIVDMAFMTWIKNPEFQKYYKETPAFKKMIEEDISGG